MARSGAWGGGRYPFILYHSFTDPASRLELLAVRFRAGLVCSHAHPGVVRSLDRSGLPAATACFSFFRLGFNQSRAAPALGNSTLSLAQGGAGLVCKSRRRDLTVIWHLLFCFGAYRRRF